MTSFAQDERHGLADTLDLVGPAQPTLCEGWLTKDLAAHLVIRDSRPDLAAGMFLPPLAGRLDRAMHDYAQTDWPTLVDDVRQGPPRWSPARIPAVDEAMNTVEFFVHHEDVLRDQPGYDPSSPRVLRPELEAALWSAVRRTARLMFRRSRAGAVLVADGYGRVAAKGPGTEEAGGLGTVVVTGRPGELLLFASGRQAAADVTLDGDPADIAELTSASLGMA